MLHSEMKEALALLPADASLADVVEVALALQTSSEPLWSAAFGASVESVSIGLFGLDPLAGFRLRK